MKTLTLTDDEAEDVRFCLARVADQNEERATKETRPDLPSDPFPRVLMEQAERLRALARKVTE